MKKRVVMLTIFGSLSGFSMDLKAVGLDFSKLPSNINPLVLYKSVIEERFISEPPIFMEHSTESLDDIKEEYVYDYFCSSKIPDDPTGAVTPIATLLASSKFFSDEAEKIVTIKEALPLTVTRSEVTTQIVKQYYENYLSEKMGRWESSLNLVKESIKIYINQISSSSIDEVERILNATKIDSNYVSMPSDLFNYGVSVSSYGATSNVIVVKGAFLKTIESESAIVFLLGHELGHVLQELKIPLFKKKYTELDKKYAKMKVSGIPISIEELWADWFGWNVLNIYLSQKDYSAVQVNEIKKNSLRVFCGYGGSLMGHPTGRLRMKALSGF